MNLSDVSRFRSVGFFGLAVGVVLGLYAECAISMVQAEQSTIAHSASSTGRLQVASAQRINLEQSSVSVVTLRDMQTHREYLIVVGGQAIPLDSQPNERR